MFPRPTSAPARSLFANFTKVKAGGESQCGAKPFPHLLLPLPALAWSALGLRPGVHRRRNFLVALSRRVQERPGRLAVVCPESCARSGFRCSRNRDGSYSHRTFTPRYKPSAPTTTLLQPQQPAAWPQRTASVRGAPMAPCQTAAGGQKPPAAGGRQL